MRTPLTKEGKEKLEGELQRLKNKERPAIIRAIATARAHGDLSENAEYTSAKEKQRFIEGRIKELEIILTARRSHRPGGHRRRRTLYIWRLC